MSADTYRAERERMLATIRAHQRSCEDRVLDPRVLAALAAVPRHVFVPNDCQPAAYEDMPLHIGQGQTISQPFIVAFMTDQLRPQPQHRVLEIGTGSGYQAAVLAQLVRRVYSVERIAALAEQAMQRLQVLHIDNVEVRLGDGHAGWPEQAPFDGILVTAAAARIPPTLIEQLKPGGRLVIPVGLPYRTQHLQLVCKDAWGDIDIRNLLTVAFVPLVEG